ncbi:MAG: hypothetical protein AB7Q37_08540 [Pyrinomonadaceae bacterium]
MFEHFSDGRVFGTEANATGHINADTSENSPAGGLDSSSTGTSGKITVERKLAIDRLGGRDQGIDIIGLKGHNYLLTRIAVDITRNIVGYQLSGKESSRRVRGVTRRRFGCCREANDRKE